MLGNDIEGGIVSYDKDKQAGIQWLCWATEVQAKQVSCVLVKERLTCKQAGRNMTAKLKRPHPGGSSHPKGWKLLFMY